MENTEIDNHKAGFVSIIGKPNVGKSTLMNKLVGEKLSIITHKAQTTRHRIMGIINGDDYQVVYSDTPGVIKPKYELHESMMKFVRSSLQDADIIIWVTDINEKFEEDDVLVLLNDIQTPIFVVINKVDNADQESVTEKMKFWEEKKLAKMVIPVSALHDFNVETVMDAILENLPQHPPFFPKDEMTDKTERFFASEIIREKIFENYEKEIPYACEVIITEFKEAPEIIRISADILVERKSQKGIVIGKQGQMLKKVGTDARKDMESFFQKKVFLQQYVKVEENWRKNNQKLTRFGYNLSE